MISWVKTVLYILDSPTSFLILTLKYCSSLWGVEAYEDTPDYRRRRLGLYERILAEKDELLEEMGEGFRATIREAERGVADGLKDSRRSIVVGRRM